MIWSSLTLKNFRSFVDSVHCELRPLTLFFGYNNAGKSALLRSVPLLSSSFRGGAAPINVAHPSLRGGSFADVLTRPPLGGSARIELEVGLGHHETSSKACHRIRWVISEASDLRRQLIQRFEVQGPAEQLLAELDIERILDAPSTRHIVNFNGENLGSLDLEFDGLVPTGNNVPLHLDALLTYLRAQLTGPATAVQWLTSLRRTPPRFEPFPGSAPSILLPDGQGAHAALLYNSD